jgi:RHS repeat-associated protein
VAQTGGLTVNSTLTKANILGPRDVMTPTAATINNPAVVAAGQINTQLAEAQARLTAVASLFPPRADRVDDHPPTTSVAGFDPNGNVLIGSDENNSYTFTRYDAIGRPIAVRIFRAGQSDSFAGDPVFAPAPVSLPANHSLDDETTFQPVVGTNKLDYQYDGLSRLTRATDNNDPTTTADDSTVTMAYDSLGRTIEETQQIGALSAKAVDSAWRAENLRKSLTYPNGRVEVYTYDHLDRLATVADQGASQPIAAYKYIGVGRMLERDYPINGTRMTFLDNAGTTDVGYDGLGRPVQLRDLRSDNSLLVGFTYTYDRMSNKLSEWKLHDPAHNEGYRYDSAYRLVHFTQGALQHTWSLDGVGNWKQFDGETRQHSSFNEITQRTDGATTTTVRSDDNGNETDDGTFTYTWDAMNRLRTVTRDADGQLVATYSYDALGRRIEKVVTNSGSLDGKTDYYLDGLREIEERNAADVATQQYVYGASLDEVVVLDRGLDGSPQRLFYYQNALGSVYALADVAARILEGYQYDAYGKQTVISPGGSGVVTFGPGDVIRLGGASLLGNPFLFTGRRLDAETGLLYYRARLYDPILGRFTSRDPVGVAGGIDLYSYAGDSPPNAIDPYGEWFHVLIGAAIGAAVGVAAQVVSDVVSGKASSWEDYAGAFVGGAAGGAVLAATGNPALAGAAGGAAGNLTRQGFRTISGKQQLEDFSLSSLAVETGLGALGGKIGGAVGNRFFTANTAQLGWRTAATFGGAFGGAASGAVVGGIAGYLQHGWEGVIPGAARGSIVGLASGALGARLASDRRAIEAAANFYPPGQSPAGNNPRPGIAALLNGRPGFSTRGRAPLIDPEVLAVLNRIPAGQRSRSHGRCAEINIISLLRILTGYRRGGVLQTASVSHDAPFTAPVLPCRSCQVVLNAFGVRYWSGFSYLFYFPVRTDEGPGLGGILGGFGTGLPGPVCFPDTGGGGPGDPGVAEGSDMSSGSMASPRRGILSVLASNFGGFFGS